MLRDALCSTRRSKTRRLEGCGEMVPNLARIVQKSWTARRISPLWHRRGCYVTV